MRASEFIVEAGPPRGKIHKDHNNVSKGTTISRDVGGYDRVYHMNRIWMATAMADGKSTKPVDMDPAAYTEKFNSAHPYTKEEHNMLQAAYKTVPSEHYEVTPWSASKEPEDIHRVSPVTGFKGFGKAKKTTDKKAKKKK